MLQWRSLPLGPLSRLVRFIGHQLPPFNFITIHYAYFMATCLLSAIIFWGSSTPSHSVSFVNCLFLTVSAMTGAGLNTVNLSTLNTFQQFMLFLLIMMGSAIFVSAFVVQLRKNTFEKKFNAFVEQERQRHRSRGRSRRRRWSSSSKTARDEEVSAEVKTSISGTRQPDTITGDERITVSPTHGTTLSRTGQSQNDHERRPTGYSDQALQLMDSPESDRLHTPSAVTFSGDTRFQSKRTQVSPLKHRHNFLAMQGVGADPSSTLRASSPVGLATSISLDRAFTREDHPVNDGPLEFASTGGRVARNSQFHGLTEKEREQLGGYEYRAVSLLSWVVPLYYVMWQLLGALGCAAWIAANRPDTARSNGLNPWWVGAFNAVSAFNNSGMSLLDANMTAFQTGYYLLMTMGLLILAGNTCYPIFLRLIVWCMYRAAKQWEDESELWSKRARTLRFLLDHPRRCYTNMFPAQHTWWLLLSVVTLNGIDWAGFEILNIGNDALNNVLSPGERVIDGLFQAFAVRSGGFYVVLIPTLRISLQVLYVVMMYISVYPVTITMRNSNVYEERSLGVYAEDQNTEDDENSIRRQSHNTDTTGFLSRLTRHFVVGGANAKESNGRFVRQQLRAQLAHDAWWVVMALFLIMVIEAGQFERDPTTFSVFNFIFEIVSGYGCVGISIGVPDQDYSFSGSWHTLSKLILCAVMLRGRHRGLPVAIDKAVLLPGESSWQAEEDDGRIRSARTMSRGRQETV